MFWATGPIVFDPNMAHTAYSRGVVMHGHRTVEVAWAIPSLCIERDAKFKVVVPGASWGRFSCDTTVSVNQLPREVILTPS